MGPRNSSQPSDTHGVSDAVARVRAYHQHTKHIPGRYAPGPGYLDWANQPDPFRRFSGTRMFELPLVRDDGTPSYDALFQTRKTPPRPLTAESLGLFLELSLGITAWKEFQDTRWALRSNPSSGNLHPTEGYVVLPPLAPLTDCPGVYHYAPHEHALEERCALSEAAWETFAAGLPAGAFLVGLSSVHWREAWKYGERAYRYCQHDAGHALGALCIAASALGWHIALLSSLSDAEVAGLLGLDRASDFTGVETEHPDLIATVLTDPASELPRGLAEGAVAGVRGCQWAGTANRLSPNRLDWEAIGEVEDATVKPTTAPQPKCKSGATADTAPQPVREIPRAAAIIRQRRSAIDMDGENRAVKRCLLRHALADVARSTAPAVDGCRLSCPNSFESVRA